MKMPLTPYCSLALALMSAVAHATEAAALTEADCMKQSDRDKRADCWDILHDYKSSKPAKIPEGPKAGGILVREEVAYDVNEAVKENKKAASFQVAASDGKNVSTAKIALLYPFEAFDGDGPVVKAVPFLSGWQSYVGAGWIRDPSAKTPKDQREVAVGLAGANGDMVERGFATLTSVKLARRHENFSRTDSNLANLNVNFVIRGLADQAQDPGKNWNLAVPYLGLNVEDLVSSRTTSVLGTYAGYYLGFRDTVKLLAVNERLSLAGQLQLYRDFRAPPGSDRRTLHYGSFSISYALPAPDKTWLVPSIDLKYEQGRDPVTGVGPVRKTSLGLGLKVN